MTSNQNTDPMAFIREAGGKWVEVQLRNGGIAKASWTGHAEKPIVVQYEGGIFTGARYSNGRHQYSYDNVDIIGPAPEPLLEKWLVVGKDGVVEFSGGSRDAATCYRSRYSRSADRIVHLREVREGESDDIARPKTSLPEVRWEKLSPKGEGQDGSNS